MELGYQTVISKLADNTIFYQQIEKDQSALTQASIASLLERFIYLADESEASIWLSPSQHDKQIIIRAKKLQAQLGKATINVTFIIFNNFGSCADKGIYKTLQSIWDYLFIKFSSITATIFSSI